MSSTRVGNMHTAGGEGEAGTAAAPWVSLHGPSPRGARLADALHCSSGPSYLCPKKE